MFEIDEKQLIAYRRFFHSHPETGWLCLLSTILIAHELEMEGYQTFIGRELYGDEVLFDAPNQKDIELAESYAKDVLANVSTKDSCFHPIQEFEVESYLNRMQGIGGVLAKYPQQEAKKLFRFDMDALPIRESSEETHFPNQEGFASKRNGIFHACGHDGHMAVGLYLAKHMVGYAETTAFLFQPAEEGVRGAYALQKRIPVILGNSITELYSGHIGFTGADTFAGGSSGFLATTKLDVEIFGKSAHAGSSPELGKNALLAAVEAINRMQIGLDKIRESVGEGVVRLNVGTIQAGEARNTIPAYAKIQIETRASSSVFDERICQLVRECTEYACKCYEVTSDISIKGRAQKASSSVDLANQLKEMMVEEGCYHNCKAMEGFPASEDITCLMNLIQESKGEATYCLFGTKIEGAHHQQEFDFDESVLRKMVQLYARC